MVQLIIYKLNYQYAPLPVPKGSTVAIIDAGHAMQLVVTALLLLSAHLARVFMGWPTT